MITLTLDPSGTLTATVPREPGDLAVVLDRLRAAGVQVREPETAPADAATPEDAGSTGAPVVSLAARRAAAGGAR